MKLNIFRVFNMVLGLYQAVDKYYPALGGLGAVEDLGLGFQVLEGLRAQGWTSSYLWEFTNAY